MRRIPKRNPALTPEPTPERTDPGTTKIETKTTLKVSSSRFTLGTKLWITPTVKDANGKKVENGDIDILVNGNVAATVKAGSSLGISATSSKGFDVGANTIIARYKGTDTYALSEAAKDVKVVSSPVRPSYSCSTNCCPGGGRSVTVRPGEDVTFRVSLACNEYCQWYVDKGDGCGFVRINGANCANFTVRDVSSRMDGYRYRCVVKNACGTVNNPVFTLYVASSGCMYFPKTGDSSAIITCAVLVSLAAVVLAGDRKRAGAKGK